MRTPCSMLPRACKGFMYVDSTVWVYLSRLRMKVRASVLSMLPRACIDAPGRNLTAERELT